jgi:ketosteroid isomerase-like protein
MLGAILAKQAVKSGFDFLNEGNLEKCIKGWDDNCIWKYPGKVKAGGTYTGKDQVRKWYEAFFTQFPRRKFTLKHIAVENIFDFAGNNTVLARWDLETTNKDGFISTNSGVTLLNIKGSKITMGEDFMLNSDGDEYRKAWGEKI